MRLTLAGHEFLVNTLDETGPERTVALGPLTLVYCVFRRNIDFFTFFFRILYLTECTMITYLTFRVLVFWLLTFFTKFIQSGRLKINVSLRNKNKICVYLDTYDQMDNALSIHTV